MINVASIAIDLDEVSDIGEIGSRIIKDMLEINHREEGIFNTISTPEMRSDAAAFRKAIEYNELLIKREKEWFHNHCIPKINKFWEDVVHYRTRPKEEVMDLVKVNKRKKEPEKPMDNFVKPTTKESLFLSDSG